MEGGIWAYLGIFAGSSVLALVLTPLALKFAIRRDLFDRPGAQHKSHKSPVPYLGGVAIVVSFALAVTAAALFAPPVNGLNELLAVLGIGVALALVGLVDDLRTLGAYPRLALEALAGLGLWYFSDGVALFDIEALNILVTVAWVMGITTCLNLIDNMDGLTAGVSAVAAGWFFVIAAANGQFLVAYLAIALVGCALGFLRSNLHPARIYMGDAGTMFLGFMLAALGVKLRFNGPTQITFFVPILVLAYPIFDTTLVIVSRLMHRLSPLVGWRDHTSHRLVFVGLPVPVAVGMIWAAQIATGWLAVVMSRSDRFTGFLLMGFVLTVAVGAGLLLGAQPVYEKSQRRRVMLREVLPHEEVRPLWPAVAVGAYSVDLATAQDLDVPGPPSPSKQPVSAARRFGLQEDPPKLPGDLTERSTATG